MLKRLISTSMAMFLAASMAGGCVDNYISHMIAYNLAPDDSCDYAQAKPGDEITFFGQGKLDLTYLQAKLDEDDPDEFLYKMPLYVMNLQVYNYILNNAREDTAKTNSMDVRLERIKMSYTWIAGRELLVGDEFALALESSPHEEYMAGLISAAGALDDPGSMLLPPISVIPYLLGSRLSGLATLTDDVLNQVVLRVGVKLIGRTLGGTRVETDEFQYPITFCSDCLGLSQCVAATQAGTAQWSCTPGQDSYSCTEVEGS